MTSTRRWRHALGAGVALLLFAAGCSQELAFPSAPLLVVSLDTLRADHLGSYGYDRPTSPTLDRIAAEGIVFENAIAQSTWTLPSHAALFTSRYPTELGLSSWPEPGRIPEEAETLAEVLGAAGLAAFAFTDSGWVSAKHGLGQGFLRYDEYGSHFRGILPRLFKALPRLASTRFFIFLHTYDVHWYQPPAAHRKPFRRPYSGTLRANEELRKNVQHGRNSEFVAGLDPADVRFIVDLYDASIHYVDAQLGLLRAELERLGVWDQLILVVTSDHGEEFLEHGRTGHGYVPYEEQVRVPLIVRLPGGALGGTRIAEQVRSIDLMPTLLDLLAVDGTRPTMRGESLVPLMRGEGAGRLAFTDRGHRRWVSLRTPEHKVMWDPKTEDLRVFSLAEDPGEQRDRGGESGELDEAAQGLLAELKRWHGGLTRREQVPTPELTDAERERLRALGYLD